MQDNQNRYAGYAYALIAASCWALLGPVSRVPMSHGIGPLEVAFWRALLGGLVFMAHGFARGEYRVGRRDAAILGLFGVFGVAVFFTCFQMAVQRGGAALASILLYTAPFWVAVFSRFIFRESLTLIKASALMLGMAGVGLVCFSGGSLPDKTDLTGIGFGLLAGFFYSLHYLFGELYLKKISAISIYMYCLPIGALVMLPLVEFSPKGTGDWTALLALGLICSYAAYRAYCAAIKRLGATRVAVLCNLEPILGALLAYAFWDETFSPAGWIGAALVLGAVFLIMAERRSGDGQKK